MKRRTFFKNTLISSIGLILNSELACKRNGNNTGSFIISIDEIKRNFFSPPDSAKPHVWWCWINGHITKDGITSDLEAMKRVGINGFQLIEFSEKSVETGPILYGSPEHFDMLRHTVKEADRLGLEFSIHDCPGWSATGGPWITPELSMQVLTWSESLTEGGKKIQMTLPEPASQLDYYRDAMVLAFPTPASGTKQITDWRKKANFPDDPRSCHGCGSPVPPPQFSPGEGIIDPDSVFDLSRNMNPSGQLTWDAPSGNWTILRIGHTTTKSEIYPGPPGGTGLECDKFSRDALEFHLENYFNKKFLEVLQPLIAKGLAAVEIDSYEAGLQNWTVDFPAEFKKYCGYDLYNYMPSMTGRVVRNTEASDRFLWDVRNAQAKLMNENYFRRLADFCHETGLKFYAEAYYFTLAPFDAPEALKHADIPMGEFWTRATSMQFNKVASSAGHLYNKPVIAGEAFTADFQWRDSPASLKVTGDINYTLGINFFYLNHMVVTPELFTIPGLNVKFGGIFNTNNTWFWQINAWIQYMIRCQYLLQQGRFAADILYFGGEDSPVKINTAMLNPTPPYGYDFDITGKQTILRDLKVDNGLIVLPHGMTYRVLFIPDMRTMTLELLHKIHELVLEGMFLIAGGPKPDRTPGLTDLMKGKDEFDRLTRDIWDDMNGKTASQHSLGKGCVFSGMSIEMVLQKLAVQPDFEFTSRSGTAVINKIHRRIGDTDVYFLANRGIQSEELVCTFRVNGKHPEFWNPGDGEISTCKIFDFVDDRIRLPLQLGPFGSVFVIFNPSISTQYLKGVKKDGSLLVSIDPLQNNQPTGDTIYFSQSKLGLVPRLEDPPDLDIIGKGEKMIAWKNGSYELQDNHGRSRIINVTDISSPFQLNGPWDISFSSKKNTPENIVMEKLISFTELPDPDVKYFSGTATYKKKFDFEIDTLKGKQQLYLDLGTVQMIAEVLVNGKNLGVLWTSPFRVNITDTVRSGRNELEIRVANTWQNRLIGNEEKTKANLLKSKTESPSTNIKPIPLLQESGLLGPVMLRTAVYI